MVLREFYRSQVLTRLGNILCFNKLTLKGTVMSRQNKARRNKVIKLQILALHKKGTKNARTKKLHNKKQVKRTGVVTENA